MTRPNGRQILVDESTNSRANKLLLAALRAAGDADDRAIAAERLKGKFAKLPGRHTKLDRLDFASLNSSWADVSVLRADWSRRSPSLALAYASDTFAAEFTNQGNVLSSGAWQTEITHAGQQLKPQGAWEELCWVADRDVDYLELQLELSGGVVLQRQLLLAREDGFLYIADALVGSSPGPWEYRLLLPKAKDVVLKGEADTRDSYVLAGNKRRALAIPLALPEWRVDRRVGSLGMVSDGIELRQSGDGQAHYAALFFDLKPKRMQHERTWRQLTVAEALERIPSHTAVGYRVQLGSKHWLIYRSLGETGNRTVLGHNLISEFLVGRFNRQGDVQSLLEIEP